MYQQYFGLSEAPFSIAPDPRYLFLSDKHREALAHLIYGVGDQGGFVVLTGEVGTGKTTICRCLLQQVPDNADIAFIINPRQSINQLLQSIFNDLHIDYDRGMTSKDLVDELNHYLLEAHADGRNTILIIDEAQNLSVDVLEQLRLLTNLETNEKKLLQLVLLGQPELNDMLAKSELRQLAQRVTARYHLSPLSKPEVIQYIEHRLSVAGCRSELFPSTAINKIYQLSKGVPRLINLICDRTLLGVYSTNNDQASAKIVANAAKEIFPAQQGFNWKPIWLSLVLAAVIVSVSVFLKDYRPVESSLEQGVQAPDANGSIIRSSQEG
ncbi:ExeA family protein [Oceanicoccus sagamiensis]|uniref:ExeA family protein n=1 Tax=Oceanicoccus sagamiensis TaxID=716816 RepID=UPI000A268E48|nr:AAA family ATPase [Oceanicoccus sagamiensis]